jgi:hypothetical protein
MRNDIKIVLIIHVISIIKNIIKHTCKNNNNMRKQK